MMNKADRHSGDMSIEAQILTTLQRVQPLSNSAPTYQLKQLQAHVYRLDQGQHAWFVKWIPDDDPRGQNEITINQSILPHCGLAVPRLLFVYHAARARIAGWAWLIWWFCDLFWIAFIFISLFERT